MKDLTLSYKDRFAAIGTLGGSSISLSSCFSRTKSSTFTWNGMEWCIKLSLRSGECTGQNQ